MTTMNGGVPGADLYVETANDRFKRGFSNWFWGSLIAATAIHFGVFAFFPDLKAADMGVVTKETEAINLPPEIEIPPPPERIEAARRSDGVCRSVRAVLPLVTGPGAGAPCHD